MRIIREPAVYAGPQTKSTMRNRALLTDHGVSWRPHRNRVGAVRRPGESVTCHSRSRGPVECDVPATSEVGHGSVLNTPSELLFTGVSRALTHELIRHRSGFGYSQLSQRYVDESVAEYVEPDVIATTRSCTRSGSTVWPSRIRRTWCWRASAKYRRKPIRRPGGSWPGRRPAACCPTRPKRRFSSPPTPGRCGTSEQRDTPRRAEIHKLASRLLDVLVKESPDLFSDYRRDPLPDERLKW